MKLSSSVLGLAGLATAEKFTTSLIRENIQWLRSSEFSPGADGITLDCNGIESMYSDVNDVKWYRMAYYEAPDKQNAVLLDEEKFIEVKRNEEGVKEPMDLGNAAEIADYSLDNGQLVISPSGGFDLELNPAAGLTLAFLCEADIKDADSDMLDEHESKYYALRFMVVPEEPVKEIIETVRSRQFEAGSSETMADCISGYSSRKTMSIAWYAVNQSGKKTLLPDGEAFIDSSKLEDTDGHTENLQVSLQFPYANGDMPLDGSYDRNFFECSVTYSDAVDGKEVTKTATKRYPDDDVIRVEHKMDAIDFTVNNILASGGSSIIVPFGEAVEVVCQPNGFKIGEDHEVTLIRDGQALDGEVVFNEEAELTCTAELDGEKVSKTVRVIPVDIGGVTAKQDRFRSSDPWSIWVNLDGTGNVDFDKDLTVTFYDKKGNVVDATMIDNSGHQAEYQLESSKAEKVVVSVTNSDIKEEAPVMHVIERSARNKEDEFCRFKPYEDLGNSPLKMWYSNCDDEASNLEPFTGDSWSTEVLENGDVAGRLENDANPGMYICCYDALNDVEEYLLQALSGNLCQADLGATPIEFHGKLEYCSKHQQVSMGSFPWWIILVLLLIIVVVIAACWFWQRNKEQNQKENVDDLEVGNVEKIHDGDGEITAEQEEQQELLDGQQQQSTK